MSINLSNSTIVYGFSKWSHYRCSLPQNRPDEDDPTKKLEPFARVACGWTLFESLDVRSNIFYARRVLLDDNTMRTEDAPDDSSCSCRCLFHLQSPRSSALILFSRNYLPSYVFTQLFSVNLQPFVLYHQMFSTSWVTLTQVDRYI